MPKRVQRRRTRGWVAPQDDQGRKPKYVGRGTPYGNPWAVIQTNTGTGWAVQVDRVRALHTRGTTTGCCNDCGMDWPCTTIQALENKEPSA